MTDHDRPHGAAAVPDWTELARRATLGPMAASPGVGGPEDERMLAALAAALQPVLPPPPTARDTERALQLVMQRRDDAAALRRVHGRPGFRHVRTRWAVGGIGVAAAGALLLSSHPDAFRRDAAGPAAGRQIPAHFESLAGQTAVGHVAALRLPDGTRVVLGPASGLDTAAGFAAGGRQVTLRGEALFDVAHDGAHPFVVHTAQGTVRDLGTSFAVSSDAVAGTVVSVRSGVVSLRGRARSSGGDVRLGAGDRARVADTGAVRVERGVVTAADVAWTGGHLALRDAGVPEVEAAMRRWYGIEFRVGDTALARRRVTASFTHESGVDAARIVAAALGGSARVAGSTVIVTLLPPATTAR